MLTAAKQQVDRRLDCPEPPPALVLCLDGSKPVATPDGYWCPAPAQLASAIDNDPPKDIAAAAIGTWQKEVDVRMKLVDAYRGCQTPPATPETK
jgi:hypothetical protein